MGVSIAHVVTKWHLVCEIGAGLRDAGLRDADIETRILGFYI